MYANLAIQPNRIQSKFDWLRLLHVFSSELDCVRLSNSIEPNGSIETFDLVRVVSSIVSRLVVEKSLSP